MCIKCKVNEMFETVIEEVTGAKFEKKVLGTASPEVLAKIQDARNTEATLKESIKAEIEAAKQAIKEKYQEQYHAAEQQRKDGWRQAFQEIGIELDEYEDYTLNTETGEITVKDLVVKREQGGNTH